MLNKQSEGVKQAQQALEQATQAQRHGMPLSHLTNQLNMQPSLLQIPHAHNVKNIQQMVCLFHYCY
jgi:hypothetical protein